MVEKACAVPFRWKGDQLEILAFEHPLAGRQFVKGSIGTGETPACAAVRELFEESGIALDTSAVPIGVVDIGRPPVRWHIFGWETVGLPDRWEHRTHDGGGLLFSFFWQPIDSDLGNEWHGMFHRVFELIKHQAR